ncbi:MAG: TatD family hydrolase [Bacteroidota bacterium]|nr:TatD family hydrolase [Bacteroidota bacterium]
MIDTHAHLYDPVFEPDFDLIEERAKFKGVTQVLLPNVDSQSFNELKKVHLRNPHKYIPMLGLHPCYVKENYNEELSFLHSKLDELSYCAVGEIGLDYYWDTTFIIQQKEALRMQIEWALQKELPIALHTRNATADTINIIQEYKNTNLRGVFHCFSGTSNEAKQIIDLGFFLGIGGVVTFKNSGLAEVLVDIPIDNILLETDAPYLAPVPFRGKRNEPAYLENIVNALSKVYNMPNSAIDEITTTNAKKLFSKSLFAK